MKWLLLTITALVSFSLGALVNLGLVKGLWVDDHSSTLSGESSSIIGFPASVAATGKIHDAVLVENSRTLIRLLASPSVFELLHETYIAVEEMTPEQIQQLALEASLATKYTIRNNIVAVCLRRLTDLDPVSTLAFVRANDSISNQRFLDFVMSNWLYANPDAAVQYVVNMEPGEWRTRFAQTFVGKPELDRAGLTFALDSVVGSNAHHYRAAQTLENASASEAFESIFNTPNLESRGRYLAKAVSNWAASDPVAAFERVEAILDDSLRVELVNEILRHYASSEPAQAVAYLLQHRADEMLMDRAVRTVADLAPLHSISLVEQYIESGGQKMAMRTLLGAWARDDAKGALAYVDQMESGDVLEYYEQVFDVYRQTQPEEALDWAVSRFDENPKLASMVLRQSVGKNTLYHALDTFNTTNIPGVRASLFPGIAYVKATQDLQEAVVWVQNHRDEAGYQLALVGVTQLIALTSPGEAVEMLRGEYQSEYVSQQIGQTVANWHNKEPELAMNWLDTVEEQSVKDLVLAQIVARSNRKEPKFLESLLDQIETPFHRDEASLYVAYSYLLQTDKTAAEIIRELKLGPSVATKLRTTEEQIRAEVILH